MNGFRQKFYDAYVSTHMPPSPPSAETYERQRSVYREYFGRFLPREKDSRLLDIGCGYGNFLSFVEKEGYPFAEGVDISREQVEVAQRFGVKNIYCDDLMNYLLHNKLRYNCISAIDVVEHFSKKEILLLLEAVHGSLKANGIFIMQAPNGASPFYGRMRHWDFTHEIAFTPQSIRQVLMISGFTGIEVHACGPVVQGLSSAARWLLWRLMKLLFQISLGAETGVFRGHILTQNLIAVARRPEDA